MQKPVLGTVLFVTLSLTSIAHASDYYLGQTGQYHTIPYAQDVQKLTLRGNPNGPCAATQQNALTLYAVDEFGTIETIPFVVPSKTVFQVTDAAFSGITNAGFPGYLFWLNIAQTSVPNAPAKASFLASRPLIGNVSEAFSGSGSLVSGAAFSTNSVLCAYPSVNPDKLGEAFYNVKLLNVVVHGTLVDNVRTTSLSW